MALPPPRRPLKGHGVLSNPPGRFNRERTEAVDDGWYLEQEDAGRVPTSIEPDRARSVITTNDSPDVGFDYSINPYRGCAHACSYCYARPSHAYLGLSPGLDFETRLFYKADAARVLTAELGRRGYVCRPIAIGANTDPYQPVERRLRVTRSILEVLQSCRHPVSIITKSSLIVRDLDILRDLARQHLAQVTVSVTTLDAELKRRLEPQAAAPQARLATIRALAGEGIPVAVLVAPVIPAITDHELERIVEAAAAAGATSAGYVLLRLPYEVKSLFREWLAEHYPQRAEHVMSLIHALRGGADNDPRFGHRMRGTGPFAELLARRFQLACGRAGLEGKRSVPLTTTLFRRPGPQGELALDL
ncbi:MAG TPA: PA0069 family radical SAM protein [Steroidobacteraceae bacterium]|nr:PA0069 family radical SAM protein [Steroidobacteraceae bacterium]